MLKCSHLDTPKFSIAFIKYFSNRRLKSHNRVSILSSKHTCEPVRGPMVCAVFSDRICKTGRITFGAITIRHQAKAFYYFTLLVCVSWVQMLQAVSNVAPRGVYVCGNATSTSGLTVTIWFVFFLHNFPSTFYERFISWLTLEAAKIKREGRTIWSKHLLYSICHVVF